MGQVRQEIDRRLQEKEDEFNNARKVHQKTAEQMQAHLESECKAKAEVLRTKKKLEADIQVIGGFQLVDLIITELKYYMTCYKFHSSRWLKLQHSD